MANENGQPPRKSEPDASQKEFAKRVDQLYQTALTLNVALLSLFLTAGHWRDRLDPWPTVAVWALNTVLIIRDRWDATGYPYLAKDIWLFVLNCLYAVTLFGLPLSLALIQLRELCFLWYIGFLFVLPVLDLCYCVRCVRHYPQTDKARLVGLAACDIWSLFVYILVIVGVLGWRLDLDWPAIGLLWAAFGAEVLFACVLTPFVQQWFLSQFGIDGKT